MRGRGAAFRHIGQPPRRVVAVDVLMSFPENGLRLRHDAPDGVSRAVVH